MIPRDKPLFVHSDVGRGLLAARRAGAVIKSAHVQESLLGFLATLSDAGEDGLIFPAFNYDYGNTRLFDVDIDPVQVGALPEWIRRCGKFSRTEQPFFSFLSTIDLEVAGRVKSDPFDSTSGFQWLIDHDATLLLFGATLASLTFIHYVEQMCGKPVYRYDKSFPGQIVTQSQTRSCDVVMHVRPRGVRLEYDWSRLEKDLVIVGLMQTSEDMPGVSWVSARSILDFWAKKLSEDPFYLLDAQSRSTFSSVTDGGVRRVQLEDFEK